MKKLYIILLIFIIIVPGIVYLCFITNGFLAVGEGLAKSDWLSFVAGYLGFTGTVLLGAIALWQNDRFKKENDVAQNKLMEINNRLLSIEEDRNKAAIAIPSIKMFLYSAGSKLAQIPSYLESRSTMIVCSDTKKIDGVYYLEIPYYPATSIHAASIQISYLRLGFYSRENNKIVDGYHIESSNIVPLPVNKDEKTNTLIISFEDNKNLVEGFLSLRNYIYLELDINVFSYLNTSHNQSFKYTVIKLSDEQLQRNFSETDMFGISKEHIDSMCMAICKQNVSSDLYRINKKQ